VLALATLASVPDACPAAEPLAAVPKGEIRKYEFAASKIFPGTVRDYWIYVPRQYDPARPACLFVCQDGIQYNAPTIFDELIRKQEMPVTIDVFVMHGRVKAPGPDALDRFNRSFEYDGLGDAYARFLIEELQSTRIRAVRPCSGKHGPDFQ
jgi:enterochelin esterase-like enzyme